MLMFTTGCVSAPATSPSPSVAVQATGSPAPAPTASPEPSRTPLVAIDPSGTGDWRMVPDPIGLGTSTVQRIVAVPDGFVALGCTAFPGIECDAPALWTSVDALTWSEPILLPTLPGEIRAQALAAAVTRAGLAVGGLVERTDRVHAALWFSSDGRSFERVADGASLADAAVFNLTSVDDRFVAVGARAPYGGEFFGFRAWSSDDGRTWVDRTPAEPGEAGGGGLLAVEDGLVAWGLTCTVCVPETAWWRSRDGLTWTATGREIAQAGARVTTVGVNEGGLIAFGTIGGGDEPLLPAAWSRGTGADRWEPAQTPTQPEGMSVARYLLVGHGAALAGQTSVEDQPVGLIWLTGPGEDTWRPPVQLPGLWVTALLQDPAQLDRLVVVGSSPEGDRQRIVLWTGTVDWVP
jgi:hypothetical protein